MRRGVVALTALVAAPLAAQSSALPRADTVQIRAAAPAFSLPEKMRSGGSVRVIADTAWAFMYNADSVQVAYGPGVIGHAVRLRAVRVERRAGRWVGVRVDPKVKP